MAHRERLSTSPIGNILSFSQNVAMVFEEPAILHKYSQDNDFVHWYEHLEYFQRDINPPKYHILGDFKLLKKIIVNGLESLNFSQQASEIDKCQNEVELNHQIIKQYTDETDLYSNVNKYLRECHNYQNRTLTKKEIEQYSNPLAPWILQLNSSIRQQAQIETKVYRGTNLSLTDIELYTEKKLFVWAPFVSASKNRDACLNGNVLFEIFTESAMSLNDKRFPRDVSGLSYFPKEEEVIYPIACAYRVHYVKKEKGKTIIGVATVDYN